MELESVGLGGAAAFREVRVQSVVVEFLLTHVEVLFSDTFTSAGLDPAGMPIPHPSVLATAPQCQGCRGRAGGLPALSLPTEAGPPSHLL
jgi:Rho GTPase-activating protein 33